MLRYSRHRRSAELYAGLMRKHRVTGIAGIGYYCSSFSFPLSLLVWYVRYRLDLLSAIAFDRTLNLCILLTYLLLCCVDIGRGEDYW